MNNCPSPRVQQKITFLRSGLILMTGLLMFFVASFSPVMAQEPTTDSDNCITCHTNQEQVQALAKEEEVKSEVTSGEG